MHYIIWSAYAYVSTQADIILEFAGLRPESLIKSRLAIILLFFANLGHTRLI